MKEFWNSRYQETTYAYGTRPNGFFEESLAKIGSPGSMLLPFEGEGRNAVYAAQQGWDVSAFDYSEEGRKKALELARDSGVAVDYQLSALEEFSSDQQFDCIAFLYTHIPKELHQSLFGLIQTNLEPGGHVIIEMFSENQLGLESGGPKDKNMLLDRSDLPKLLEGCAASVFEEVEVELDEGPYHQGLASVTRVFAKREL